MDVAYVLDGITFVWDSAKGAANVQKHGVSFEGASEAILDPFVKADDPGERGGEIRVNATGLTRGWILLRVTFTLSSEEFVRIISARRATARERESYEAG